MKIKDLKEKESFELQVLLQKCNSGVTNTGSPYLSLNLQDSSGSIEGKVWDAKPGIVEKCVTGEVITIKGTVNLYQQNLQLKITDVSRLDQSTIEIEDFIMAAPIESFKLKEGIEEAWVLIQNSIISKTVRDLLDKNEEKLYQYPAASRNHHDYFGGLAMHIRDMVKLALAVCEVYPSLNRDLLIAGVLLHDLGKIKELSGPIATEYTTEGKLIGHISLMQSEIAQYSIEHGLEDSEELLLLRHMILSHHGEYDFGSPVLPLIKEAEVLSFIDNIDARINMIDKALATVKPGEFAMRSYSLENRGFYKPKDEK